MSVDKDEQQTSAWFVYFLRCSDNSLYCGVTTDIERRQREHNTGNKGAKYTRVRRPVSMVYQQSAVDRSEACKLEASLKKLTKKQKEVLVLQHPLYPKSLELQ